MDVFEKDVLEYIRKYHMFDGISHCVCGVSGGADSVSLLTVLARHRAELGIDIHVVHINHMIRGEAADGDQSYVETLSGEYGVTCDSYRIDVRKLAEQAGQTVEEAGRHARYDAFDRMRARYVDEGCVIAVAHNRNDVAETVLFNMARGTGMGGIKGIAPVRNHIVRPLLGSDRSHIEEYLGRQGIRYCTDATNNEDDYTRNKIRHRILPLMNEINGQATEHICQMAMMAADYERLAAGLVDDFLTGQGIDVRSEGCGWTGDSTDRRYELDMAALKEQDRLVQELVIRKLIGMVCGGLKDIGMSHVSEVTKLYSADTGAGINLPAGARVWLEYGRLVFAGGENRAGDQSCQDGGLPGCVDIDITCDGEYELCEGRLTVRIYDRPEALDLAKKECTKFLDYGKIKQCLQLRTFENGDYIVVNSAGSRKKLNLLYTDCKIPVDKRRHIPLVTSGQEVVWAVGLRIGENYKVTEDTQKIIELNFNRRKQS